MCAADSERSRHPHVVRARIGPRRDDGQAWMRCQRQRHIGHVSRQPRVLGQDELVGGTPGRENQLGGIGLMLRAWRLAVLVLLPRDGAGAAHVCLLIAATLCVPSSVLVTGGEGG